MENSGENLYDDVVPVYGDVQSIQQIVWHLES